MNIIGVDFSGAKSDNNTWMADGYLDGLELNIRGCRPISRALLTALLENLSEFTIAALDFPFSVPTSFAQYWSPDANDMTELWAAAGATKIDRFIELRDSFVAHHGEPKRHCDRYYTECYSPLHKTNPNMVPMTFYGMRMLHSLWNANYEVPPLKSKKDSRGLILEVMPGAVLKAMKLPYKGYKNGVRALELREQILEGLNQCCGLSIPNLSEYRDIAIASHDCLDAIVAAVAAALWAIDPELYRLPEHEGRVDLEHQIGLEGWLYAPRPLARVC